MEPDISVVSFWDAKLKSSDSWLWKSLLKIRHLAQRFLKCRIGSGTKAWFWHDNWTSLGPLLSYLGHDGPRELQIPINAKVSDACNRDGWSLPSPRTNQALSLHIFLSTIQLPSSSTEEDHYGWYIEDKLCAGFSASKTWEVLRERESEIDWADLIWFKVSTPKHSFHMWVTNLDRLPTRSRLASWGLQVSPNCCLCAGSVETREHLFLHCNYTQVVWNAIFTRLRLPFTAFGNWASMLTWAKINNRTSPKKLRLLLIHALVYNVWRQRNNLIHNQISMSPLTLFKDVNRQIINTITARRTKKSFRNLMALWLY